MQLLLPMNCGFYRRSFLVSAEITPGNALRLIRNYQMPDGAGSGGIELPDRFTVQSVSAAPSWRGCPFCGAYDSRHLGGTWAFWACSACKAYGNPGLNCAGPDNERRFRCACGYVVTKFGPPATTLVRGFIGSLVQQASVETIEVTYVAAWRR